MRRKPISGVITMNAKMLSLAVSLALVVSACSTEDAEVKESLVKSGYSEQAATELSTMGLDTNEVAQLTEASRGGFDGNAAVDVVKTLHDKDLKFDIGVDMQVMSGQGFNATALVELVEIGAIPRWTDDLRALKSAEVGDVAIVEIAKLKFVKGKEVLSGNEYTQLKKYGISDSGLLTFVKNNGTEQQLQQIREKLMLGESEQAALQAVGM